MRKNTPRVTPGYVDLEREVVRDPKGRRVTNARVRDMVDEVHAATAGRPSLTRPGVHSPEVKARVPEALKNELDALAQRRGVTTSALVREALETFLKSA